MIEGIDRNAGPEGRRPPPIDSIRLAHQRLEMDGYYLLRDLPIAGMSEEDCGHFLLELVRSVAVPIPQNRDGDLIVRIEDEGQNYSDPRVRGHKTNAALAFHTDRTDLIFLLYVRKARIGGNLKLADSRKVVASLERHRPGSIEELRGFFPNDAKREQGGLQDWFMSPILFGGERPHCRYIRRFIEESQRFADAPRLTQAQLAVLDAWDGELARPENSLLIEVSPGDLLGIDNHRCLHARDAYEDAIDRRLAMRAWAAHSASPDLPPSFASVYHSLDGGTVRGGFVHVANPDLLGRSVAEIETQQGA